MSATKSPALSSEQLSRFDQDGYLVVPDLLSDAEVEGFIANDASLSSTTPRGLQYHKEDQHWSHFAQHPRVVAIVHQLLQGPCQIVQTMYMDKAPDGGTGVALHQDTHYIRNEPNTLMACWLALNDTDRDNGGLCVLPGSHKNGLYSFEKVRHPEEHAAWEKSYAMRGPDGKSWDEMMHSFDIIGVKKEELKFLQVPRGAGVFFTSMTVHGSYANRSGDRPRLAFATHYIKKGTWIYRADLQDLVEV